MSDEYSVALWVPGKGVVQMERCIAASSTIKSIRDAALWAYKQGISRKIITDGQRCEIDVSEDASEDWTTVPMPY